MHVNVAITIVVVITDVITIAVAVAMPFAKCSRCFCSCFLALIFIAKHVYFDKKCHGLAVVVSIFFLFRSSPSNALTQQRFISRKTSILPYFF